MNMIELSDVTFSYGRDEAPVFRDFSFSAGRGTCTVIEGENGSGKTTLFRILNGLSFPQRGRYLFDGTEIDERYLRDDRNAKLFHKRMGFLFQDPDVMLFNGTVYDEIAFGPRQMGLTDGEVKKRTEDCMEIFDLSHLAGKAPYHLSGGQKKKVALAAVMSLNPEVLVLDEPFAELDRKNRDALTALLAELKDAGKTMLISTHDPEMIGKIADNSLEIVSAGIDR